MSLRRLSLAIALAAILAGPTSADPELKSQEFRDSLKAAERQRNSDWFKFWSGCKPVFLFVGVGLADKLLKERGLNRKEIEDTIATAARSRLRAARIYANIETADPDAGSFPAFELYVYIADVEYLHVHLMSSVWKVMDDPFTGIRWSAIVERSGRVATVNFDLSDKAGELTDEFIDEYLRVNADSCD